MSLVARRPPGSTLKQRTDRGAVPACATTSTRSWSARGSRAPDRARTCLVNLGCDLVAGLHDRVGSLIAGCRGATSRSPDSRRWLWVEATAPARRAAAAQCCPRSGSEPALRAICPSATAAAAAAAPRRAGLPQQRRNRSVDPAAGAEQHDGRPGLVGSDEQGVVARRDQLGRDRAQQPPGIPGHGGHHRATGTGAELRRDHLR